MRISTPCLLQLQRADGLTGRNNKKCGPRFFAEWSVGVAGKSEQTGDVPVRGSGWSIFLDAHPQPMRIGAPSG
jgi:hypothetical protein